MPLPIPLTDTAQTILTILHDKGRMTEPELRELVYNQMPWYVDYVEFFDEVTALIRTGHLGVARLGRDGNGTPVDVLYKRVRTRPIQFAGREID